MGWNLSWSNWFALHQNVANCQNTLSEYIDSAHTEVEDLSSRYMNGSNVYDRCGHDTRQLHPSCTACRKTANLPGRAWQNEACSRPHHSNHRRTDTVNICSLKQNTHVLPKQTLLLCLLQFVWPSAISINNQRSATEWDIVLAVPPSCETSRWVWPH